MTTDTTPRDNPQQPDPQQPKPWHHDDHDDFGGLDRDFATTLNRRRALTLIGFAGAGAALAACGASSSAGSNTAVSTSANPTTSTSPTTSTVSTAASSTTSSTAAGSTTTGSAVAASAGAEIPTETNGPYPADGTNGPNILETSGLQRADITASIGELSGTVSGIPMTLEITIADAASGNALAGAAVYVWHCTPGGQYSIYEIADQNYLRGLQVADANGVVRFTSVYAGCYRGRWPHVHFEVYQDAATATNGKQALKVSQLAFPQDVCEQVYTDSQYGNSLSNLGQLSLDTDNVFRDGYADELATVTGDNANGYTVSLLARV